ncbi:MAG: MATE family efflux transporter [Clostridiales bacterium]|nr:MATE family efflux transporter [Clostridiales bacterium]
MTARYTTEGKLKRMTETPIPRLLFSLAVPTIITMLISAFYNMADTYFIGRLGSASATAATGVIFPMMAILQAIGFMFGQGSGNYIARALGAKKQRNAEEMASTAFFSAVITGILLMALGQIFLPQLVVALGSTETIAPYAIDYARNILFAIPWLIASIVLNNQLRLQGNALFAMVGMTSGAIINIGLDPLFIFTFGMGVAGASMATMFSQMIAFVLLFLGTRRGDNLRIRFSCFTPTLTYFKQILRGGVPALFRQSIGSLSIIMLNTFAGRMGDPVVAAFSIVFRIMMFIQMIVIGLGQGFQPICGFNYGSGRYDRVREAYWFAVRISFFMLLGGGILAAIFAPQLVNLFLSGYPEVTEIGSLALRLRTIMLPFFSVLMMSSMLLQTIGHVRDASILAIARQGLFLLPALLILPHFFGLFGLQLAQPISDFCAVILSIPLGLRVLNGFKREEARLAADGAAAQADVTV